MGAKGEAYAKQFEAKVAEATALLERLSAADWQKMTAGEKWTVTVTASGTVFTGMSPMTAEEMVKRALLGHIDEHVGSIQKTIGG